MLCARLQTVGSSLLAALLILSSSSSFAEQCDCGAPAKSCCGDICYADPCCGPTWYVQVDALILTRDNASRNQTVVQTDSTGTPVLTTRDLNFDWNAGPRVFVGRFLTPDSGFEVGYFGINGSTASARAVDPNNLDIPPPLSAVANDFDNANAMTLSYDYFINNAEVNLFEDFGSFQLLGGFRYFNLDEQFNIRAEDADGDVSDYHLNSTNNLYGGQLGLRTYVEGCKWGLGATGKVGVYGNNAGQRQIVRDNDNETVLRNSRGSASPTAFVGDIDLFATYRFTDHWRLRGGYYLLWASDLALAPDQLDFTFSGTSGTGVDTSGNVFFHGATVGLEASW
jgi:hypothetical protein